MDIDDIMNSSVFRPQNKYYTANEFNSFFHPRSSTISHNFSLMHINIRSLQKNFDTLEEFLRVTNQFPFSVIAVTETWLHESSPPIFDIDNYQFHHVDRKNGKGGGVAFYIRNDFRYKIRHDIVLDGIDTLFLEIINNKHKNIIVGVIYRPPNNIADVFLENFESCLELINQENKDVYITGDFNIDLSLPYTALGQRFINILSSSALTPLINKPTRITNQTHTIIDNIFTNAIDENFNGIIYYDISDHLPIFTVSKDKHFNISSNFHKVQNKRRIETKRNIDSLMSDLNNEGWDHIYLESDVNKCYNNFISKFNFYYDKNIPLKTDSSKKKNKKTMDY